MLSTPVCGVLITNAAVGPLPAPCLRSDAPSGITPHEHTGSGMPSATAFKIAPNRPPPKCSRTARAFSHSDSTPATAKPPSTHGAISPSTAHACRNTSIEMAIALSIAG